MMTSITLIHNISKWQKPLNKSMKITEDEVWDVIGCDDSNSPNSDEEGEEQIEVKLIVKFSEDYWFLFCFIKIED